MLKVKMPEAYKFEILDIPVSEPSKDKVLIQMKRDGVHVDI